MINVRVGMALPNHFVLDPRVQKSLDDLVADKSRCNFTPFIAYGPCSAHNFNRIILRKATSGGCDVIDLANTAIDTYDYLLLVDSDNIFTPQDVFKLLDRDLDYVTGVYESRYSHNYNCGLFNSDGNIRDGITIGTKGLVEVDWCGTGLSLIKSNVLKKMKFPYFVTKYKVDDVNKTAELVLFDVYFSKKVTAAGFKIFADCDVKIGHIGVDC